MLSCNACYRRCYVGYKRHVDDNNKGNVHHKICLVKLSWGARCITLLRMYDLVIKWKNFKKLKLVGKKLNNENFAISF